MSDKTIVTIGEAGLASQATEILETIHSGDVDALDIDVEGHKAFAVSDLQTFLALDRSAQEVDVRVKLTGLPVVYRVLIASRSSQKTQSTQENAA